MAGWGCLRLLRGWCSVQAKHSESTEERRADQTPVLRSDTGPHPQTSMGWPKQKNYTHFFNVFYIIHIQYTHLNILQMRLRRGDCLGVSGRILIFLDFISVH